MARLEYTDWKPSQSTDFELHGHPGRFYKTTALSTGTQYDFTGSDRGVGGVILTNTDATIHLSGGGSIPGTALNTNELYELSISKIVTGASGAGYALYRNTRII